MEEFFYEIFEALPRQGPGSRASTQKAFEAIKGLPPNPRILDIGCGTGKQTFDLVELTNGNIIALDNHPRFVEIVNKKAQQKKLSHRVRGIVGDMNSLDFNAESFDLIWAEGSIFIIGFTRGLSKWRPLLKSNGYMALSDLVWLKSDPPEKVKNFLKTDCPDMKFTTDLLAIVQAEKYFCIDHFILPREVWWEDYYQPMAQAIPGMRKKYPKNQNILKFLDTLEQEIQVFQDFSEYYGYVFFILQKHD